MESLTEIPIKHKITETRKFILKKKSLTNEKREKLRTDEVRKL